MTRSLFARRSHADYRAFQFAIGTSMTPNHGLATAFIRTLAGSMGVTLKAALMATTLVAMVAPTSGFAADASDSYLGAGQSSGQDMGHGAGDYSKQIQLGIGKSYVLTLPRDAKELFVADGGVVKGIVRTARKAYLIGVAPGQTDVKFIDAEDREIASYEVSVSRDVGSIRSSISRSVDGEKIRVEGLGDGVVVTGSVKTAQEAQTAIDIAAGYMTDPKKVVNALKVEGQDQVMLRVRVVEMKREIVKQLGINYSANGLDLAGGVIGGSTAFGFGANNSAPQNILKGKFGVGGGTLNTTIQALERSGVIRTLAEPNLTAISGESAKFLAGGQYPFPGSASCEAGICTRSVEFKDFGVALNFTPVVLTGGRISLKIATEVSELDPANGIEDRGLVIPGLSVRRADSTVEVPSGGTVVMAGLIQQQTKRSAAGLPGLMKLPVLGALFRSNDFLKNETELAIFVTPYLAKPVAAAKLASPDDGFAEPSDPSAILLGRLNRLYGIPGKIDPSTIGRRKGGFIVD